MRWQIFVFIFIAVAFSITPQIFANATPCKNYPIGQNTILANHSLWVNSAQFSPDGNSVITALGDGSVRITQLNKTCIDPSLKVKTSKLANDPQICIKCKAPHRTA